MGEREISFLPHVRVIWTRIISVYHFWAPQHLGQYHLSLNRIPSCSLSYYFGTFEALLLLLSHIEYPIDYEQSLLFGEVRPAARKYQFFFSLISLTRAKDFAEKEGLLEVQVTHDLGSGRSLSPGVKVQSMKNHTTTLFHKRNSSKEERKEEKTKRTPRVGGTSLIGTLWEGSQLG